MNLEIEAKFASCDHDELRSKLKSFGAVCELPLTLMRRTVYHPRDDSSDSYVRVRDEGNRVTMTYKRFHDTESIHGTQEIETTVGDYDNAIAILDQTGLLKETYQETKREVWRLGEVEIMLDEWPWVDPFVEIEGPSEAAVREVSESLGFDWSNAIFGNVASVYLLKYRGMGESGAVIINRQTPIIRFEDNVPETFKL